MHQTCKFRFSKCLPYSAVQGKHKSSTPIIIIIVYYAEAAENIKHTHTIHAYTIKQFKHTNKNTYYVKSMR